MAALALAGVGVAPSFGFVLIGGAVMGAGLQYGNVMWETLMQEAVPQRILGRVTSLDWFVSLALEPASLAFAAPIAAAVGSVPALVGAGLLDAAVLAIGYSFRGVRNARPEQSAADVQAQPK